MSTKNATKSVSLISGFSRRLFLSTALAMIIAALLSLIVTVVYFNAGLRPYLVDKSRAVAESVQQDIQYAISIGIPFVEIRGLEQHITKLVDEHPEVREMRVVVASEQADMPKTGALDRVADIDATTEEGLGYQVISSISEIGSILFRTGDAQEVISVEIVENDTVVAKIEALWQLVA